MWLDQKRLIEAAGLRRSARVHELDGIRGWAAITVVLYHLVWEAFGHLFPWIKNPITATVINGKFAVCIFFILSGEALSAGYFAGKGNRFVARLAVWRYFRLTIPILATALTIWALYKLGMTYNQQAGEYVGRPDWLGAWLHFPITINRVIKYAFFDVYWAVGFDRTVDPFLWTMGVELFGSAIVFCILFIYPYLRRQSAILFTLGVALLILPKIGYIGDFVMGVAFAHARYDGLLAQLQLSRQIQLASWIVIFLISSIHGLLAWKGRATVFEPALAAMLLMAIFSNRSAFSFFGNNLSRRLGTISFPIYLAQFPVIISLTSFMVVAVGQHGPITIAPAVAIIIISFLGCILLSIPFIGLEYLTKIAGNRFSRFIIKS